MNKKFIAYIAALLIFLSVSNCYSIKEISLKEFKKTYNYLSANQILYYEESNLDNDEEFEKVIIILDGEYSFFKVLIAKKDKIVASIDIDDVAPDSDILKVYFKNILDLNYNQIIMEIYFQTYDRGLGEIKALSIVSYVNGNYKQIFYHKIEHEYRDSFEGWTQYIKWDYSITSDKNAKIIFTNTKNSLIDANNKKLEPPKIDKTEEYVWNGTEFKRVNWSIYRE